MPSRGPIRLASLAQGKRGAVGRNVLRKEGAEKVTGAARYIDDVTFPGMLHARTIRSTIPRGDIGHITFAFDTTGFTIVDYRDVPGRNIVALIDDDQPCLVERTVRHVAEPILLLAHEDRDRLLAAEVRIDYRPAAAHFDPETSPTTFKTITIEKGTLSEGFDRADVIVEGEYRTGHQEQLYIETNGVIAVPEADGGITVYGSMQCPYYVHKALKVLMALPADKVRVVQTETGGGFGGKEEYPSMIAGHAALLARKAGRPVKLIYDRVEDMVATTKRHPSIVRHKTGVTRDGRLTAMDVEVVLDGGAYSTLSAVVLSRGVIHAGGPYRCDHIRIRGRAAMTNTPPNGAFRGFGAPQTQFAVEVHMDCIADRLGLDPVRIRELNALRAGDTTATGQRLGGDCSALQVLRSAVKRTRFQQRRRKLAKTNRGIGLSLFFHGSGFTGGGEVKLASKASLALTARGVRILVASTEIGQGTRTMHAQIVADTLGIPYDAVEVNAADTGEVPDSGPTVASRTCMVVGGVLERAARGLRARVEAWAAERGLKGASLADAARQMVSAVGEVAETAQYEPPPGIEWDDATYTGSAYPVYGWACCLVDVAVDLDTYEVTVERCVHAVDVGKAIHPVIVEGQIEGGTLQALGWALIENVVYRDGKVANANMTNCIVPTFADAPELETLLVEVPYPHGPHGAKGVGEIPMDGPAAAVAAAIEDALGVPFDSLPILPEVVEAALRGRR